MRVLLIQPPYDLVEDDERQAMPPLGLAYIAAVLERQHHEVNIIDCVVEDFDRVISMPDGRRRHGLAGEALRKSICDFRPDVVGVSCLFSAQAPAAHDVCRYARESNPKVWTVMGGAHPSAVFSEVLQDSNVDFVVTGEGELIMLRLVESLAKGQNPPGDPSGLAFRCPDGIRAYPQRDYLADLDALPLPARHLLPMDRYFRYRSPHGGVVRRHPCTNMITSRGCPAKCCFCSIHTVWGRRFRWHSADRVVAEIESLVSDYGVREIQFEDDNLTLHKPRMRQICKAIIDRNIDVTWTMPNGMAIWAVDEKLLSLMREAGCYHITVAIESGSQDVLTNIINKPVDLKRVDPILKSARKLGMGISAFFVVGFPGETKADLKQTFDYGVNLDADQVHFFTATPYPGTRLFEQCVKEGLISTPVDYTKLRIGRPMISTSEWSAQELGEMARMAQAQFYRRSVVRRPVQCASTVAKKFARDPGATLRKVCAAVFPRRASSGSEPAATATMS